MTVFIVDTCVVKPKNQGEFIRYWRRLLRYVKKNPEKFKELKSLKLFTQTFGGISSAYVEMWEFDGLADWEKWFMRVMKDEEIMKIYQEFLLLIDSAHTP